MNDLLQNPEIQAGVAPLVVALVVGFVLHRTRYAWLAIVAAYVTFVALSTGFQFEPLTAGRKVVLLALLAPVAGILVDAVGGGRMAALAAAAAAGLAGAWTFVSVLGQRETNEAVLLGAGIALFVALLTWLVLRLRGDGLRTGAAGVGLGLAVGIAAVLSASIGFFMTGIAIAAGAGAMLLVQIARGPVASGALGALSIAIPTGLAAAGTFMLASLPWYALPALLAVPAAVLVPSASTGGTFRRAFVLGVVALVAAAVPILAAWFAARGFPF